MSGETKIPAGWTTTTVGEIARAIQYGHTASATDCDDGPRFLRITDIQNGRVEWTSVPSCDIPKEEIPKYRLHPGDIVFARTGTTTGKSYLIRECPDAVFASYLIRLRMFDGVFASFVQAFFQTTDYWRQIEGGKRGIGRPNVNANVLAKISLPLAPEREQRRIVAKLEELFSDLDAGVAALERAMGNLKRYRAAVLKAAVEGKLTEEWRAKHRDIEPAAKLLDRILAERRRRWQADQLAKFAAAGKSPPMNWKAKYTEPTLPDTANLPDLPKGWCWATVQQVSADVRYGTSAKASIDPDGIPVIRMGNIVEGKLDLSNLKYLPADHAEFPELLLEAGEVLFNRTNSAELVGKSAVYEGMPVPCSFASYLIGVRCLSGCEPKFMNIFINSAHGRRWVKSVVSQQVGQANVNGSKLQALAYPLPPSAEQAQIVAEVDQRLSVADEAEQQIERSLHRAARLRQSILKRAFEGKLIPQDPNDEPASVLLDRIRKAPSNDSAVVQRTGRGNNRSRKERKR